MLQKDDSANGTQLERHANLSAQERQERKVRFGRSWRTSEKTSVDSKEAALLIQK